MNIENSAVVHSKTFKYVLIAMVIAISTFASENAFCWDDKVNHPDMTERSIATTELDNYLVSNLGISEGKDKEYTYYPSIFSITPVSRSILRMLQIGSTDEDDPMCRASNHFHDPLKTWDDSYLTDMTAMVSDR